MAIEIHDDIDPFVQDVEELLWYAEATHICDLPTNSYNRALLDQVMDKHTQRFIDKWNPKNREAK